MSDGSTLGWAFGVLFREWQRRTQDVVDVLPHGPRGFQILDALADMTPPRQGVLAAHLGIDRTVFTYVVDDLVAAGLMERRRDPKDRRVYLLALTDAGVDRVAQLRERVAEAETELLSALGPEQAASLRALAERAAAELRAGERDACRVAEEIAG
ncbi:winged helix-turn-helix transcriptional regulator [Microbacteriaceae bacterium VKM Ac-2854]|nr:winged helix-turn-helix transcriptional regulator [Microbacteriaceae bacterium VKM Ac-2854]